MWFKRKTKKEKEEELQQELNKLIEEYSDEINSYCKINDYIFILIGFKIINNKIVILFKDKDTFPGYINSVPIYYFNMKYYNSDFKKARVNFIQFKEDLKKLGLKLEQY